MTSSLIYGQKLYAKGSAWVPARFWKYVIAESLAEEITLKEDGFVIVTWAIPWLNLKEFISVENYK